MAVKYKKLHFNLSRNLIEYCDENGEAFSKNPRI